MQVFRKGLEGAPIMEKSDEEWDFVIDINLTGMFRCLRAELSRINPGGSVVNLTSTVGMIGLPMDSPYCVSKHGVSFSEKMRLSAIFLSSPLGPLIISLFVTPYRAAHFVLEEPAHLPEYKYPLLTSLFPSDYWLDPYGRERNVR